MGIFTEPEAAILPPVHLMLAPMFRESCSVSAIDRPQVGL